MANPTAASAAATVITKKTSICPVGSPRNEEKAMSDQVYGIEHQLNRHENNNCIAADQNAQDTDTKHERRKEKIIIDWYHSVIFFFARITAPTIAANNNSEVISNGKMNLVKRTLPMYSTVPISAELEDC